jgi:hypothetical protein
MSKLGLNSISILVSVFLVFVLTKNELYLFVLNFINWKRSNIKDILVTYKVSNTSIYFDNLISYQFYIFFSIFKLEHEIYRLN